MLSKKSVVSSIKFLANLWKTKQYHEAKKDGMQWNIEINHRDTQWNMDYITSGTPSGILTHRNVSSAQSWGNPNSFLRISDFFSSASIKFINQIHQAIHPHGNVIGVFFSDQEHFSTRIIFRIPHQKASN